MDNLKALQALALMKEPPVEKPGAEAYAITIRLPGELSDRIFPIHDWGPESHMATTSIDGKGGTPNKPYASRNRVIVALVAAGLEAVEAAAADLKTKGKK